MLAYYKRLLVITEWALKLFKISICAVFLHQFGEQAVLFHVTLQMKFK